jgi:hypothetical protein
MFDRLDAFTHNPAAAGFRRYRAGAFVQFDGSASRQENIGRMIESMRQRLGESDVADVRVGLVSPGTTQGRYGHALSVQRMSNNGYSIFDPNNGAFVYSSQRNMEDALRRYMDEAFNEGGLEAVADSVQYYTTVASQPADASTTPPPPSPGLLPAPPPLDSLDREAPAFQAYWRSAEASNGITDDVLSRTAGFRRAMGAMCSGLTAYVLRNVAQGQATNLMEATENLRERLSDRQQTRASFHDLRNLQRENQYALVTDVPNHIRHMGAADIRTASDLVDDLRGHFGSSYYRDHALRGHQNDFVQIGLTFRSDGAHFDSGRISNVSTAEGHSIIVQRLRPSTLFGADEYEIYDPYTGVFRYPNFAAMSDALRGVYERGYAEFGGIDHADTTYLANTLMPTTGRDYISASQLAHEAAVADLELDVVEQRLGVGGSPSLTLPLVDLPPPPNTVQPAPYGRAAYVDLRRSINVEAERKPAGLFRPSTVSPASLRRHGGFDCEHTKLGNIDLSLHNFDVAANPRLIDSAGYLGTFRSEQTAMSRMPDKSGNGYIYFIAPTPNMIDVNGTLGSRGRAPETNEVAAMGWIDYPQIRGWRVVKNGVPGKFVRNPDYRWDVYDQTLTAGAQLKLSRFPIENDVWREARYNAYVTEHGVSNRHREFNEPPDVSTARFYDNAWQKVRDLQARQASGLDYRGPIQIQAYNGEDNSNTHIYFNGQGDVEVNTANSNDAKHYDTRHDFTMGDDGRFHQVGKYGVVLRVGSDGNVYRGSVPEDAYSRNGVFAYDAQHHLVHEEDRKFLTVGLSVYTPFVSDVEHGLRSQWKLHKPGAGPVVPPQINMHSFQGKSAGNAQQLYFFDKDPDAALPASASSFVTGVPGSYYRGNFLDYCDRITAMEANAAARWLHGKDAAWLFKDGYYAVSERLGELEVRKLDGTPVWRAEGLDSSGANFKFKTLTELSSDYRVRDETWQRIEAGEQRRTRVLNGARLSEPFTKR